MKTGDMIKDLRMRKGMTQEDLAEKTGISVRSIQRIENGQVAPRADSLHKIADVLGVTFDQLNSNQLEQEQSKEQIWLVLLHLSGIFMIVIPTWVIWVSKDTEVCDIKQHAIDAINFQLNVLAIIFPCALLSFLIVTVPILVLAALFGCVVIMVNSIRVALNQSYRYPIMYAFLKP